MHFNNSIWTTLIAIIIRLNSDSFWKKSKKTLELNSIFLYIQAFLMKEGGTNKKPPPTSSSILKLKKEHRANRFESSRDSRLHASIVVRAVGSWACRTLLSAISCLACMFHAWNVCFELGMYVSRLACMRTAWNVWSVWLVLWNWLFVRRARFWNTCVSLSDRLGLHPLVSP